MANIPKNKLYLPNKPSISNYYPSQDSKDLHDFFNQTKVSGTLRSYFFTRNFSHAINQKSYSGGGNIYILTGTFLKALKIGLDPYTAQPFGLNSHNHAKDDQTLPDHSVTVLAQSFLQFHYKPLKMRAGYLVVNTPWVISDFSRMIPSTFNGIIGSYFLTPKIELTGMRVYSFKGRSNSNYTRTNLYNPSNPGGTPILELDDTHNHGTVFFGVRSFLIPRVKNQIWFYQFYNFAKLFYLESSIILAKNSYAKLFIEAQGLTESGDNNNYIQMFTGEPVESNAYGVLIGTHFPIATFSVGFNEILQRNKAFRGGDIVSPYTSGYAVDPLYTTSMINGLVEKAAGIAIKFTADFLVLQRHVDFRISYASYKTQPFFKNSSETDYDLTYFCKSNHQGLSLRDRLGVLTYFQVKGLPPSGRFIYNRVMLQYNF